STGRWIAILDADDLVSENWFLAAARRLAMGDKVIVHPELNWLFDAAISVLVKPDQDGPMFAPHYFSLVNYYDALCIGPREAWVDHPSPPRAIKDGFAFEDWQWAIETMVSGFLHVVEKDTIVFKRRRDTSQTYESKNNFASIRSLEVMAA